MTLPPMGIFDQENLEIVEIKSASDFTHHFDSEDCVNNDLLQLALNGTQELNEVR